MKRIVCIAAFMMLFFVAHASALGTTLLDMRNKIVSESGEIRTLAKDTKDALLLNSMWDTCILTVSQLDAYFAMLGIFNTIETKDLKIDAVDYLVTWLNVIKTSNDLNIRVLDSVEVQVEPVNKAHAKKLSGYYRDLNKQINEELVRIFAVKALLRNREQQ